MDTILMSSEISKTSDSNRLLLNLSEKINSKRSDKHVDKYDKYVQVIAFTIHEKKLKSYTKT